MALHFSCQHISNVAVKGIIYYKRTLEEYVRTWLISATLLLVNQTVVLLKYAAAE